MLAKSALALIGILAFLPKMGEAQQHSFLFTFDPPDQPGSRVVLHYDAAFGQGTFEPLGGDKLEQTLGIRARLSESTFLTGRLGFAMNEASSHSSQHIEFFGRVMNANDGLVNVWVGPGFRHEYSGTSVLLGRVIAGRHFESWEAYANILLEKPLAANRDGIDIVLTAGWSYFVTPTIRLGIEGIGQDLEGFWDEDEAEGGARLFLGPTFVATIPGTSWTLTLGAGPIFRATQSSRSSSAIRDLPLSGGNGFVVHGAVSLGL